MRRCSRAILTATAAVGLLTSVHGDVRAEEPEARTAVAYDVRIEGIPGRFLRRRALRRQAEGLSNLVRFADRPPATLTQLRHRARQDIPRIEALLRSEGWMAATVAVDIDEEAEPVRVTLRADPGPRHTVGDLRLEPAPDTTLPRGVRARRRLTGQTADTPRLQAEERRILRAIQEGGHPWPALTAREVRVREDVAEVEVTWTVDPGPTAVFGPLDIRGLVRAGERFVAYRVRWDEGDPVRPGAIRDTEAALLASGLFSSVRVRPDAPPQARPDALPMVIELAERKPMTVRVGLEYQSDIGFGGRSSWEHRNLWGDGERLEVSGRVSEKKNEVASGLSFPDLLGPDIRLDFSLGYLEESPDAYERRTSVGTATVTWEMAPRWTLTVGVGIESSRIIEADGRRTAHWLAFTPVGLEYSDRDDPLDPTRGWRIAGKATPYVDLEGDQGFTRLEIHGAHYVPLSRDPRLTFAVRGMSGVLSGTALSKIPANLRYYAGGGTSIRGYAYQSIGADDLDPPTGGNALVEGSAELRVQFARWGFVAFADAGDVFDRDNPARTVDVRWSSGLGIRYATPIGPLRIDGAVPGRRRRQDDPWQIYVSLGQAF